MTLQLAIEAFAQIECDVEADAADDDAGLTDDGEAGDDGGDDAKHRHEHVGGAAGDRIDAVLEKQRHGRFEDAAISGMQKPRSPSSVVLGEEFSEAKQRTEHRSLVLALAG